LLLVRDVRRQGVLQQVVTQCRRDGQQQTGRCRQRRGNGTGSHQANQPGRHVGNFRHGDQQDVVVHLQLVTSPATLLGLVEGLVRGGQGAVVVELDTAVVVLVFEDQKAGDFPVLEPLRTLFVNQRWLIGTVRIDRLQQVQARHRGQGRHGGVEQGNEDQSPARRP